MFDVVIRNSMQDDVRSAVPQHSHQDEDEQVLVNKAILIP
jgi:hypothetical protein